MKILNYSIPEKNDIANTLEEEKVVKYIALGLLAMYWSFYALLFGFMYELIKNNEMSSVANSIIFLPWFIILAPILAFFSERISVLIAVYTIYPGVIYLIIKRNRFIIWFFHKLLSYPYIYSIYWGGLAVSHNILDLPLRPNFLIYPAQISFKILENRT